MRQDVSPQAPIEVLDHRANARNKKTNTNKTRVQHAKRGILTHASLCTRHATKMRPVLQLQHSCRVHSLLLLAEYDLDVQRADSGRACWRGEINREEKKKGKKVSGGHAAENIAINSKPIPHRDAAKKWANAGPHRDAAQAKRWAKLLCVRCVPPKSTLHAPVVCRSSLNPQLRPKIQPQHC